MYSTKNSQQAS